MYVQRLGSSVSSTWFPKILPIYIYIYTRVCCVYLDGVTVSSNTTREHTYIVRTAANEYNTRLIRSYTHARVCIYVDIIYIYITRDKYYVLFIRTGARGYPAETTRRTRSREITPLVRVDLRGRSDARKETENAVAQVFHSAVDRRTTKFDNSRWIRSGTRMRYGRDNANSLNRFRNVFRISFHHYFDRFDTERLLTYARIVPALIIIIIHETRGRVTDSLISLLNRAM